MLNSKVFRTALGVLALAVFILSFTPSVFTYKAIDGVINARVAKVTSPIEGEFNYYTAKQAPVRVGDSVYKGQKIALVNDVNLNRSYYYELQTERASLEKRVKELDRKAERLNSLKKVLSGRLDHYRNYTIDDHQARKGALSDEIEAARARLSFLRKKAKDVGYLARRGVEAKLKAIEAKAEEQALIHTIEAAKKQRIASDVRIEAAKRYVFMGDGHNDSAYSNQRIDQIDMELASNKALQEEARERIVQIQIQGNKEMDRIRTRRVKTVSSPVAGIIWQLPVSQGDSVVIADTLLRVIDCQSLFLDVLSDEVKFDHLKRGDAVEYRLYGDEAYRTGFIDIVQGSGMIAKDTSLAANLTPKDDKQSRVVIRIDEADLPALQGEEKACNVGRKVIVRFNRSAFNPGQYFASLI